ncbi:restriction endonuclease subunit S, partial [Ileibacterium valens]
MEKDKLEPKLRFPGFTEPWEHRKLATIATFAKGRGYSKNDLTDRGTPLILYGRLYTNYSSAIETVDTYAKPLIGSVYSKGGEVIVPASGETAEDIARASAVISKGFLLGGDLNIINPNSEIDPVFLALQLSNGYLKKELASKAQGKSVVHIHNSDLENLQIIYPSLVEQMKVSTCIRVFEHLITLHQRKEEELQKLKKGL